MSVVVADAPILAKGLVAEFYDRRGFQPAWTAQQIRELQALVDASHGHGLDPRDYHGAGLGRYFDAIDERSASDLDILATDILLRLASHLRFGKVDPRSLYPDWNFAAIPGRGSTLNAVAALLSAPSLTAAVEAYTRPLPFYSHLREALARYRAIEAAGGWPEVPPGAALKLGSHDPRIPVLRARLAASGDGDVSNAASEIFDDGLATAVVRFQRRHALVADGIVGPRTLMALNVDVRQRIDQLRVNLERVRWMARDLAGDHLLVDVAGFTAQLQIGGQRIWASRAVVGRAYRSTPSFRATVQSILINPPWFVPPTILREDVIPAVISNPQYLDLNSMRVMDAVGREIPPASLDWKRYLNERFPFSVVQSPGGANPLGAFKFEMPNEHAIYLHDTPNRNVFERQTRALSSGCVRVEDAQSLAAILLDDAKHWNADALRAAVGSGQTRRLSVKRRVPVLLVYRTAEVDDEGIVYFRPDLYGRDVGVLEALSTRSR
jgi:murein L,D-transpeptidase YcbB/YkuD